MFGKLYAFFEIDLDNPTKNPMSKFYKVLDYCKDYQSFKITRGEFILFVNNPHVYSYYKTYNESMISRGEVSYDILFENYSYLPESYIKFLGVNWEVLPDHKQFDSIRDTPKNISWSSEKVFSICEEV